MSTLKTSLEELQNLAKERTVKTQTIEYDLETLVKKIKREVIKLNPDYQRRHRWSNEISSRLIESLILNIPIPFVYISQDIDVDEEIEDGHARYSVIDGQQRLTAIYDFFENKYPLTGLDVLEKLNNSYYKDLPPFLVRRLEERSIRCLRIDSTVDQQVKYDIFERLNSGSVKLEAQELRNATCRGKFNELIKVLSKIKDYRELISLSEAREKKMEDEELVLRYFSLSHNDGYKGYKSGFKKFLTSKMVDFNSFDNTQLELMEKDFRDVISFVKDFSKGDKPFAKYKFVDGNLEVMSNFNAAVFDAVMYLSKLAISKNKKINLQDIRNLFSDEEFFSSCEGSVNDISKIATRITKAADLVI
ncbi:DUF262 domain-containing protein [Aeromonas salmonicida]